MNRDIKRYRKDIKFRREELLEEYYLFDITREEFEYLMDELDDCEDQIDELEQYRKKLRKLKKEQRKIDSQKIINGIRQFINNGGL